MHSKHTEGKWKVVDRWNVLSDKRLVANCGGYRNSVDDNAVYENEANARRIVQAVNCHDDLVEALEKAHKTYTAMLEDGYFIGVMVEELEQQQLLPGLCQ